MNFSEEMIEKRMHKYFKTEMKISDTWSEILCSEMRSFDSCYLLYITLFGQKDRNGTLCPVHKYFKTEMKISDTWSEILCSEMRSSDSC